MMRTLDTVFSALADSTRRAIIARLCEGPATVSEIVDQFDLTQPTISKHLKVLERAGLVTRSKIGQRRPCHIQPDALQFLEDWLTEQRCKWENLDALFSKKDRHKDRNSLSTKATS